MLSKLLKDTLKPTREHEKWAHQLLDDTNKTKITGISKKKKSEDSMNSIKNLFTEIIAQNFPKYRERSKCTDK